MHIGWSLVTCLGFVLPAQAPASPKEAPPPPRSTPRVFTSFPVPEPAPLDLAAATRTAIDAILRLQEGDGSDQWPYEGVYREDNGQLPVGYRVGGTSITCMGLMAAPGYAKDEKRVAAVERGVAFVLKTLDAPRMQADFIDTYDVRGWGHIYALQFFLHMQDHDLVPKQHVDAVTAKTKWLVQTLVDSAIPKSGGWNYSRPAGYRSPRNGASTFMTAPALQALFHAKARGHAVSDEVIEQALEALERSRAKPGGYAYKVPKDSQAEVDEGKLSMMDKTPSSASRASACETTLMLAGRGDPGRLERAVELFFEHWDDLAVRKSQKGTHIMPYGIAPYYFLYGHLYVAQAIEQIPDADKREGYRKMMQTVLARSREEDGSWNDRQFGRSGGYGTAMALMAIYMPQLPKPVAWSKVAAAK